MPRYLYSRPNFLIHLICRKIKPQTSFSIIIYYTFITCNNRRRVSTVLHKSSSKSENKEHKILIQAQGECYYKKSAPKGNMHSHPGFTIFSQKPITMFERNEKNHKTQGKKGGGGVVSKKYNPGSFSSKPPL